MIGIYKITSPTGKVYIGQSIDVERRFRTYKIIKRSEGQIKLHRSFLKHTIEKHKFEILCECEISELNDKERCYQDLYSVLEEKGMNCNLTKSSDRSGKHSDETKLKMSISGKGKKLSEETKKRLSISKTNMSEETKIKIGLFHKGRKRSNETKLKISTSKINPSDETRLKMSLSQTGRKQSKQTIQKRVDSIKKNAGKIILDNNTGIFYKGIKEVAIIYNMKYINIAKMLSGHRKNKTNLIYV